MERVLDAARRQFSSEHDIRNVLAGAWVDLKDEQGQNLPGIRGRMGVSTMSVSGHEIGVDLIEMAHGAAFPMHTHHGDHILFVISGHGIVVVGDNEHRVKPGDTIFIAAEQPHATKQDALTDPPFTFLAFGHPHKPLDSPDRMTIAPPPP